ncbi:hypothetical protein AMES_9100 [Amycolatopsis mediterranei S699]|uniref:S1 motif domain-containing protein n=2 Tax=Amycolatopsis mediterranei TaxID=33910 RepID=A0A0H3DJR9_AMYMU|nr:hypothetical protein [Amycolatopsis mediterranei]ADJ50926.1 hypothetical protein AMED_9237 [Amycolatopsis mediterranei U32]AEK47940.1 hypothetical protein RAM_47375 [Amycolatopsis mediterranei S699]AFO82632.1 hypothetical protein AMES_9100 [Amycolatopsis mediterranei S699]AGT89761.1 hypothetical protein B737_9101 [Amycolatopsis mediterranei RB]KDO12080.1 hypothetical protein DV26_03260 [Amycolatopsis mediterranei]
MSGFEVGAVVTGTVSAIPRPGAIGLFVDLEGDRQGFVDVLILPRQVESWPAVGTTTTFEVLARRPEQVRLWPLDPEFRSGPLDNGVSEAEWRARKERYPVGTALTAEVTRAFVSDGSYLVRYEGGWSLLEGDGEPPEVGTRAAYEVVRHLDTTRRTLLRPGT